MSHDGPPNFVPPPPTMPPPPDFVPPPPTMPPPPKPTAKMSSSLTCESTAESKTSSNNTDSALFPHEFYTTGAMEATLDNMYQTELARTQIELDDREHWPKYFKEHLKQTSRLVQEAGVQKGMTMEEALEFKQLSDSKREILWHQRVFDAKRYVRRPMPHFRRSLNPRDTKGWQCVIGDKNISPALWAHDDLRLPIGSELKSKHHARRSFFLRTGGKVYNVESRRFAGPLQVRPKDVNTKYILSFDM